MRSYFEVRKGVSIPPRSYGHERGGRRVGTKWYPFSVMAVGDMFFIPCGYSPYELHKRRSRVICSAHQRGVKVEIRTMLDPETQRHGIGVWLKSEGKAKT